MADYYEPTVVQQIIPDADMTPLERLLLSRVFESERIDDGWYFFAEQSPCSIFYVTRAELEQALSSSPDIESTAHRGIVERLLTAGDTDDIEIDCGHNDTCWERFFQDIVKRSRTLRCIIVITAFTCTKMCPEGFGGMAQLITRDAILGKSTNDILEDFLTEAGLDDPPPRTQTSATEPDTPPAN